MGKVAAVFGLALLALAAVVLGGEWMAAYPGISGGVAVIASSPLLLGAGLVLALIGVVMVNLFDPESEMHLGGGVELMALVLLFVIFELVF